MASRESLPAWRRAFAVGGQELGRWWQQLSAPVDGATVALFRVAFGVLLFWQALEFLFEGRLERYFVEPLLHFTYPGFAWVRPLPEAGMRALFWAMAASAVGVAIGWRYRLCALVLFLTHTYQFLLDTAYYNNHDYLIALLALLLVVVPADATAAVGARRHRAAAGSVPLWSLWLLRFQILVPYTFGGLAKLDADWLIRAQPMRIWLTQPTGDWRIPAFDHPGAAYFFSWSGLGIDLLAAPGLLWRRSRPYAMAVLAAFHLVNSQLFEIGVFPWLMLAALVLFAEPSWPRRVRLLPPRGGGGRERAAPATTGPRRTALAAFVAAFVLLQLALPLRHLLYPGDVDWTEEGHRFAWRMKLRDKRGEVRFVGVDRATGRVSPLDEAEALLTPRQRGMMLHDPYMMRQFAGWLARELRERGQGDFEVRVVTSLSLNGLPPRALVDPQVDLAAAPASVLARAEWILP